MLKGLHDAVLYLILAVIMAGTIGFVVLNLMVGCDSWSNPACVDPVEFVGFFFP